MDISIIVSNYNGEKLLRKNIPRVIAVFSKYRKGKKELIIVDDASKDGSFQYLETLKNISDINIKIIKNDKNLGFSSTVNKGVNISNGEIVILLNTDVIPEENFIEPVIKDFKDTNLFAVGFLDKSIENNKKILRGRGIGKWKQGFLIHSEGEIDKKNTLWASGGSSAFRKDLWERLGGLCEIYNPFYWEDIDLSYRALKAGYNIVFEKDSITRHEHEEGVIRTEYTSYQIKKTAYRNQFFFVWINITDKKLLINHFLWLPLHILFSFIDRDIAFFSGFFSALLQIPKAIIYRKKTQQYVVKSDKDIVQLFQS